MRLRQFSLRTVLAALTFACLALALWVQATFVPARRPSIEVSRTTINGRDYTRYRVSFPDGSIDTYDTVRTDGGELLYRASVWNSEGSAMNSFSSEIPGVLGVSRNHGEITEGHRVSFYAIRETVKAYIKVEDIPSKKIDFTKESSDMFSTGHQKQITLEDEPMRLDVGSDLGK